VSRGGILLVGTLPAGPLVGGVEVGVRMILDSDLTRRHGIRLFNTARRADPSRSMRARLTYQLGRFTALARDILTQRPRLVHVKASAGINYWQGACYCAIARLFGRRVLFQLHGGVFDSWYTAQGAGKRRLVRASLRLPSEILVLSGYWRDFLAGLAPAARIRVFPNGVQIDEATLRVHHTGRALRVATVGSLGIRKGHFDILEAAALLADQPIHFVFAGADENGGEMTALRERARVLGIEDRVTFAGPVTGPAKWRLLAESDVFLLPSRGENMPNAVLEAMAAGLPLVCTPVGAIREMVEDGALIVPVGAPAAIAGALRQFADDPAARARLGRQNRERVEAHYSFALVAKRLDEIYSEGGPMVQPFDTQRESAWARSS
jgi:glycosyltransferase involved in cell wall biosynthesis